MERIIAYTAAVVALHHAFFGLHAAAHGELGILPSPPQLAFIIGVIFIAPVAGLGLILLQRGALGAPLLVASLAASLVFGVVSHVYIPGPDNFSDIPSGLWGSLFEASGILLALFEGVGVAIGAITWVRLRSPGRTAPA